VILGKLFWDERNMDFSVECDRAKCNERVGKNNIEIRVTNEFLRAKKCECVLLSDEKCTVWYRGRMDRAF